MIHSGEHAQWEAEMVKGAASMEEAGRALRLAFAPLRREVERLQAPGG